MKIDHDNKTIAIKPFELVVALNYVEHCIEEPARKTWKLVPELSITRRPAKAPNEAVERLEG